MPKQLTKKTTNRKQKKFIKKVVETGGNIRRATDLAGYAPGHGYHLMKQPKIQTELQLALENAGLTDDSFADKLKEGQEATYVKKDGGKKYKDFHAIHKYLDMQAKITGGYAPEKHEITQKKLILNITLDTIKGLKDARGDTEVVDGEVLEEQKDAV